MQHAWARWLALQCKADEAWRRSSSSTNSSTDSRSGGARLQGQQGHQRVDSLPAGFALRRSADSSGAGTNDDPTSQSAALALPQVAESKKKVATEALSSVQACPTQNAPASPTLFFFFFRSFSFLACASRRVREGGNPSRRSETAGIRSSRPRD